MEVWQLYLGVFISLVVVWLSGGLFLWYMERRSGGNGPYPWNWRIFVGPTTYYDWRDRTYPPDEES